MMDGSRSAAASFAAVAALCLLGLSGILDGAHAFVITTTSTTGRAAGTIKRADSIVKPASPIPLWMPNSPANAAKARRLLSSKAQVASTAEAAADAPNDADEKPSPVLQDAPTFLYRKTFWQPSQEITPVPTESKSGPPRPIESSASEASIAAPAFTYRQSFWQPFIVTSATLPAAEKETTTESDAASATSSPAVTNVAADTGASAPAATTPKTAPTTSDDTTTSKAASATTPESVAAAAVEVELAEPEAAKQVASSPPPQPVTLEAEPTLISDSPVYEEVAISIKRAKEFLAPFGKKVRDNVAEGNMGERGEEWVAAQFAILLFVAMGSIPVIGGLVMVVAGPGMIAGGVGLCAAGVKGLGKSLSPWPAPVGDNELETEGVYGLMRHPMYTGLVMLCVGYGVLTDSPIRMLLALALALVLDKKATEEEKLLVGLHGNAYKKYCDEVAKFVPRVY